MANQTWNTGLTVKTKVLALPGFGTNRIKKWYYFPDTDMQKLLEFGNALCVLKFEWNVVVRCVHNCMDGHKWSITCNLDGSCIVLFKRQLKQIIHMF